MSIRLLGDRQKGSAAEGEGGIKALCQVYLPTRAEGWSVRECAQGL